MMLNTGTGNTSSSALNDSAAAVNSLDSAFWSTLIDQGVPYKSLIALLFYFMDAGQNFSATSRDRDLCLKSTGLYFVLLAIPGSGAFKIFHAVLYNKALDTYKLATKLHLVSEVKFSSK